MMFMRQFTVLSQGDNYTLILPGLWRSGAMGAVEDDVVARLSLIPGNERGARFSFSWLQRKMQAGVVRWMSSFGMCRKKMCGA